MAKNNVTIRNERGEVVMVINRAEWERSWLEAQEAEVRAQIAVSGRTRSLRARRRELRAMRAQMRDQHEMEGR